MSVRPPAESFPPGTVLLGKYRVVRVLGVGGMGVVVEVEHLQLSTPLAMKLLRPELAALPDAATRFIREARAATRIMASEHIVRVLDVGTIPIDELPAQSWGRGHEPVESALPPVESCPYIVMEYLRGQDLGRLLKSERVLSVHEAIDLAVQASYALAHAHRAGVVHRDVKPANLFLTERPDGSALVKVLDFGISKVVEEAAQENLELTKTKAVMGSALYMSLEQMRNAKDVDHRTDIYALGVTLYEMLTRSHPFAADSFSELCVKVSLDPPVPLRAHRPEVSEELADVIARAYARLPGERWPSAGAFASALAPFAALETQATIEAIQRFEAKTSGEMPMTRQLTPLNNRAVTVSRPPPDGGRAALPIVVGAICLVVGGLITWWVMNRVVAPQENVDAGVTTDVAASASNAPVMAVSAVVPPPPSVPIEGSPSLAPTAPLAPSGGALPTRRIPGRTTGPFECRRGERFYVDPRTGLRMPCP